MASGPIQQMLAAALVTAATVPLTTEPAWNRRLLIEAQGSRRAARQLRDIFRERLRGELDALRERQVRVKGHGEVIDGQPELDRERWLGDHLPSLGGEDVRADNLLGVGVRHELDESPRVPRRERPRRVLERQLGDERLDSLSSCLVLSKADG